MSRRDRPVHRNPSCRPRMRARPARTSPSGRRSEPTRKRLLMKRYPATPAAYSPERLLWGAQEGKADGNSDGVVTRSELLAYLVRESAAYCARHPGRCARGLTPQLHGGFRGNGEDRIPARSGTRSGLLRCSGRQGHPSFATRNGWLRPASLASDSISSPAPTFRSGVRLTSWSRATGAGISCCSTSIPGDAWCKSFPNAFSKRHGVSDRIRAKRKLRVPGDRGGFRFSVGTSGRSRDAVGHRGRTERATGGVGLAA